MERLDSKEIARRRKREDGPNDWIAVGQKDGAPLRVCTRVQIVLHKRPQPGRVIRCISQDQTRIEPAEIISVLIAELQVAACRSEKTAADELPLRKLPL